MFKLGKEQELSMECLKVQYLVHRFKIKRSIKAETRLLWRDVSRGQVDIGDCIVMLKVRLQGGGAVFHLFVFLLHPPPFIPPSNYVSLRLNPTLPPPSPVIPFPSLTPPSDTVLRPDMLMFRLVNQQMCLQVKLQVGSLKSQICVTLDRISLRCSLPPLSNWS